MTVIKALHVPQNARRQTHGEILFQIKDGLTVRSDLFSEVEEVLGFIRKHINKGYIITLYSLLKHPGFYFIDSLLSFFE